MSEDNQLTLDSKLEIIKENLCQRGFILSWVDEKGLSFKVVKKEWDPKLWNDANLPKTNKWPHNSLWIKKEEKKYICELAWLANKRYNEDRGLNAENCVLVVIRALVDVCKTQWAKTYEAEKFRQDDQTGIRIPISELPNDGDEIKFVNDIIAWVKSNIQNFIHIQDEIKKGNTESEIENIKQNLIKEIQMKKYINLLLNNHNIILHGAPGTGKTYLAKQIAKDLIFTKEEHDLIDRKESEIADADRERYENLKEQFGKRCAFVQFHQSYDYTDFVEGLRPIKQEKEIGFELRSGVFKDFCKDALEKMNESVTVSVAGETREIKTPFIFIIDEINRGEMSKIFGELFYSIDPGYRVENEDFENGKKPFTIRTQYSNLQDKPNEFDKKIFNINESEDTPEYKEKVEKYKGDFGHFFVPENVYIIGTMNDIDRSVESMDFAMRRRFAFEEITAKDRVKMLDELQDAKLIANALAKMMALNDAIENIDGLSSAYHIGPAYFLKLKKNEGDFNLLWKYHIEGVVKEYLRGMDNADAYLKELTDAYFSAKSVNDDHNGLK